MNVGKAPLAMALLLLSEAVFFILLILAYLLLHDAGPGPKAPAALDVARTGWYTVALLASSITLWRADANRMGANAGRRRLWLAFTIVLGSVFLIGQSREYQRLAHAHITIDASLFATSFFTLTGFHGLHVVVGLVLLAIVTPLSSFTNLDRHDAALTSVGMYWHFVDVVWMVIFAIVYLGWTL
jgi:heme/copper-type cytochrome/quinol oxidase subunit 3